MSAPLLTSDDDAIARLLIAAGLSTLGLKWKHLLDRAPVDYMSTRRLARRAVLCARRAKMIPMLDRLLGDESARSTGGLLPPMTAIFRVTLRALLDQLRPVLADLERQRVTVMLIKGSDLAVSCYPQELARSVRDIDLLVRPWDVPAVVRTFRAHGYDQGAVDRRGLRVMGLPAGARREMERDRYELLPLLKVLRLPELDEHRGFLPMVWRDPLIVRDRRAYLVVNYDVHHNAADGIDPEDLWARPRRTKLPDGVSVLGQAPSRLFWLVSGRLYYETMTKRRGALRGLFDVAACACRFRGDLDWDDLLFLSKKYGMHVACLSVVCAVDRVAPGLIPGHVIERLTARAPKCDRSTAGQDLETALFTQRKRR